MPKPEGESCASCKFAIDQPVTTEIECVRFPATPIAIAIPQGTRVIPHFPRMIKARGWCGCYERHIKTERN